MLLNSVIIILREVLEAALIISVFLAFTFNDRLQFSRRWLVVAIILGGFGAIVYAFHIDWVSELMDGIGQEVTNAVLHLIIYVLLLVFNVAVLLQKQGRNLIQPILYGCVLISVVLVITLEGSEMLLFIYGFYYVPDQIPSVLIGSTIGAGIGFSIGIILFYILVNIPNTKLIPIGITTIMLIGAGMISQATQQFIQADILPSQSPLWDSSAWLSEQSVMGQLLYAFLGYEATPTPIQVLFYFASFTIMIVSIGFVIWRKNTQKLVND